MKVTDPEAKHLQHISWAITFSEGDLGALDASALDNLRIKLFEFIVDSRLQKGGIANDGQRLDVLPRPLKEFLPLMTQHRLGQIQRQLKDALSQFAEDKFLSVHLDRAASWITWGAFTPESRFFRGITVPADPATQTLVALGLHIEQSGITGERIRRCAYCKKVFIKERKPKSDAKNLYCRQACGQAVANATYRAAAKKERRRRA